MNMNGNINNVSNSVISKSKSKTDHHNNSSSTINYNTN